MLQLLNTSLQNPVYILLCRACKHAICIALRHEPLLSLHRCTYWSIISPTLVGAADMHKVKSGPQQYAALQAWCSQQTLGQQDIPSNTLTQSTMRCNLARTVIMEAWHLKNMHMWQTLPPTAWAAFHFIQVKDSHVGVCHVSVCVTQMVYVMCPVSSYVWLPQTRLAVLIVYITNRH